MLCVLSLVPPDKFLMPKGIAPGLSCQTLCVTLSATGPWPIPMSESHPVLNGPIRFSVFELDSHTGELRKHGIRIKLQEQPLQVLQILLENPGQMVTREDLQRRLWPSDTFVEFDKGIYNAIKRLREALGDTAETPRFIETLPKRGYRFIGMINGENGHVFAAPAKIEPSFLQAWSAWPIMLAPLSIALLIAAGLAVRHWRAVRNDRSSVPDLKLIKLTDSSLENPVKYVALSPNGKFIAFTDALGVHVKEVDTEEVKSFPPPVDAQLPSQFESDARLPIAWFPDGTRLLVNTNPGPTMWSISLLTGKSQKLGQDGWASSVSPDGSLIAFLRKESEVWVMGSRGEQPRAVARAELGDTFDRVMWSPDSRRIAYLKIHHRPEIIECAIETRPLESGPPTAIISDPQLCQEQPFGLWTPDDRIVYSLRETVSENSNLWAVRVNRQTGSTSAPPVRLTNWPQSFVNGISGSADGKRLVFRRTLFRNTTYLLDLASPGSSQSQPMRLLLAEKDSAWPTAWTSDSRAVVFYRMNGGNTDIFKQEIDGGSPETLLKTPGEQLTPRLSPDGSSFIYMYVPSFERFGAGTPVRLMRLPAHGGPSDLLVSRGYVGHRCPRLPASFCVLGELSSDQRHLILYAFDPLHGPANGGAQETKRQLVSIEMEPGREPDWDISPDGSLLAISAQDEHEIPIRFVALGSRSGFQVAVKGWGNRHSMFWSADGRSIYISSRSSSEETLLQVDLQGRAIPLFKQKGAYGVWGVPSPDGRYLALFSVAKDPDVWMAENF